MASGKTSQYYKSNPKAAARRRKQQRAYNKLNRKLGTYGNGDGKDASHTGPNSGKLESPKKNRSRPRRNQRYA